MEKRLKAFRAAGLQAEPGPPELEDTTGDARAEYLGQIVHDAWCEWAMAQPLASPEWIGSWEDTTDEHQEADRQIGIAVSREVTRRLADLVERLQARAEATVDRPGECQTRERRAYRVGIVFGLGKGAQMLREAFDSDRSTAGAGATAIYLKCIAVRDQDWQDLRAADTEIQTMARLGVGSGEGERQLAMACIKWVASEISTNRMGEG